LSDSIGHYKTIFYADLADISKALALAHFPLATIALITGFFTIADRKQNLIFYSLTAIAQNFQGKTSEPHTTSQFPSTDSPSTTTISPNHSFVNSS
jgi:hypothetical protein